MGLHQASTEASQQNVQKREGISLFGAQLQYSLAPGGSAPLPPTFCFDGGSAPKIHQKGYLKTGVETDARKTAQRRPKHLQMAPETAPKATSGAFRDDSGATLTEKCALSQNPHFYYGLATFAGAQRPHFRVFSRPKTGQEAAKRHPRKRVQNSCAKVLAIAAAGPPEDAQKWPKSAQKSLLNRPWGVTGLWGYPPGVHRHPPSHKMTRKVTKSSIFQRRQ